MPGTPQTGTYTNTFAIDDTQRYSVVAQTRCRRIFVQKNFNSATPPTADLQMAQPSGATLVNIAKGTPAIFSAGADNAVYDGSGYFFKPGQIVGDIETVSGSITVRGADANALTPRQFEATSVLCSRIAAALRLIARRETWSAHRLGQFSQ